MKIRHGFISNSSSTSFTFIFKGNGVEDLCAILPSYASNFRLRYEMWSMMDNDEKEIYRCDVNDIINSLKSVVKDRPKEEDYYTVYARHIDEVLESIKEEIEQAKERQIEFFLREDRPEYLERQYCHHLDELIDEEMNIEDAKNRGLDCVIQIGFGDNHGDIQGGRIGIAMDYEGRYIRINQDDLVVITEQNR